MMEAVPNFSLLLYDEGKKGLQITSLQQVPNENASFYTTYYFNHRVSNHSMSDSSYTVSRVNSVMDRSMELSTCNITTLGSETRASRQLKPAIQCKVTGYLDIAASQCFPPAPGPYPPPIA